MADADKNFLTKLLWKVETWCFAFDPETKQQSSKQVGETSPRPKKLKIQRYRIKTTLIIFFDSQGVVLEGKTVNAEFYKGVMDGLLKHIQQVCPAVLLLRFFLVA